MKANGKSRLKPCLRRLCGVFALAGTFFAVAPGISAATDKAPQTYVIVHGASGGGWDWRTVDRLLTADGNTVYRPTLTGLGERVHLANAEVNLTTHVTDIVNVILFEDLHDVILVGHSYAGMVITGVMDRIPERIRHVVFLDAAAPADGQSFLDYWHAQASDWKVVDGLVQFPWLDSKHPFPRDVPQPLKTFTEPVSYRSPLAKRLPVTYIWFNHPDYSAESRASNQKEGQRLHQERGWTIRTLDSDHVAERTHPKELAVLLEDSVDDQNSPAQQVPAP